MIEGTEGRSADGPEQVRAWKPTVPGISEVFHARFTRYAYPAHAHSTWTLFLVDDGAIRYDLDRHPHGSDSSTVGVLPPHVVHDGRPATSRGFRKRVLYLSDRMFGETFIGPAVDRPAIVDPLLRGRISTVHQVLDCTDSALEAESRLAFIVERLRHHLRRSADGQDRSHRTDTLAEGLRALLDAHLLEPVTLAAASERLGASPAHLVRSFTKTFGVAPHAYQVGRRIEVARQWLLEGRPVSDVAVGVGFHDQSHFTRHFKRHVGTTPGRYAADPRRAVGDGRR
ncbi:AraC family transcriptional regulator [Actinopolymorpha sp. B17G11]|uniref:helix-turn-helix domain-containing protein n=1 Tax=unclassified Actinopolymorpha TaxID=2627063 RepID=UPI0032D8D0D5